MAELQWGCIPLYLQNPSTQTSRSLEMGREKIFARQFLVIDSSKRYRASG
jgi:hypothetical protein